MYKIVQFFLFIFVLLANCTALFAQAPVTSSSRLFRVQEAHIMREGALKIGWSNTGFYESAGHNNPIAKRTDDLTQYNSDLLVDYAVLNNLTLSGGATLLQKTFTTYGMGFNREFLSEVRFSSKLGSISTQNEHVQFGALATCYIPISGNANAPFIPYSSGYFDGQFLFLMSYYFDNVFYETSPGLHFNFGIKNFFTSGSNQSRTSSKTQIMNGGRNSVAFGVGFKYPTEKVDFFTEVSGEMYVGYAMPEYIYSREDYAYLGIGATWRLLDWLSVEPVGEFLLLGGNDKTVYDESIGVYKLSTHNYLPFKFSLSFSTGFGKAFSLFVETEEEIDANNGLSKAERQRNAKIRQVISDNSQELVSIYKQGREIDDSIEGSIYFDIVIGKDGRTKNARILVSTFDQTPTAIFIENQMLDRVRKWIYPSGDSELQIEILKLSFTPKRVSFVEESAQ
ncbi:hypothetical protein Ctha_1427 [Chloroherpeton thalassium ATCC 35110]|uniref:TonB family protein n=1 Tax=Chloroherpeton thalassium (strain ATCC 35110 / GB-78) TaxID=517418 RepID=B3QRT7_CHLT3|nr:hypothetical protein [Chloroherpeton thalassium]ACF13890.1 hypothetical protein Ctha_1427 [Chloroherpeton thalassium ATCC 35110]